MSAQQTQANEGLVRFDDLPSVRTAHLPAVYQSAMIALEQCSKIDECATWANKMEAIASYARQSNDESLMNTAMRIKARAIRRCGELLKEIAPSAGGRPSTNGHEKTGRTAPTGLSRRAAAKNAGLSKDQQVTAVRVASVPKEEFELKVESASPPTITALAEQGTKAQPKPLMDLQGRDPEDFKVSTQGQGALRRFAEFAEATRPKVVVRGALPHELPQMREAAARAMRWLSELQTLLKETV